VRNTERPSEQTEEELSRWAHFEFTRKNIGPTILRKKIEENPDIL
jgi:hypothetical protein